MGRTNLLGSLVVPDRETVVVLEPAASLRRSRACADVWLVRRAWSEALLSVDPLCEPVARGCGGSVRQAVDDVVDADLVRLVRLVDRPSPGPDHSQNCDTSVL